MKLYNLYLELLKTEDLFEMYDGMVGIWEEDRSKFKNQQEALESFTNNLDVDGEFVD